MRKYAICLLLLFFSGSSSAFAQLPKKVLGGYLRVTVDAGVPYSISFSDQSFAHYNVVFLFNACNDPAGPAGRVRFMVHSTYGNMNSLASHIQTIRAKGVRVILTVGGAGCGMHFPSDAYANHVFSSIRDIISQLGGVDGIDWNSFETLRLPDAAMARMVDVTLRLKALYEHDGKKFSVTMPVSVEGAQQPADKRVARMFKDAGALSAVFPQFYDWPGNDAPELFDRRTSEWLNDVPLAPQEFGLGMRFHYAMGTLSIEEAKEVWRKHTNLRGVFVWDIGEDKAFGYEFANAFGPLINPDGNTPGNDEYQDYVSGQSYAAGDIVRFGAKLYIAVHDNPGYHPVISHYFWDEYTEPAGYPDYVSGQAYRTGDIVKFQGKLYIAVHDNPGYHPTISHYFWDLYQQ